MVRIFFRDVKRGFFIDDYVVGSNYFNIFLEVSLKNLENFIIISLVVKATRYNTAICTINLEALGSEFSFFDKIAKFI